MTRDDTHAEIWRYLEKDIGFNHDEAKDIANDIVEGIYESIFQAGVDAFVEDMADENRVSQELTEMERDDD